MIAYIVTGLLVTCLFNYLRYINSSHTIKPCIVTVLLWWALWPFVVVILVFDGTMKVLDCIHNKDE